MKKLLLTTLCISQIANANTYIASIMKGQITNSPFGFEKQINGKTVEHSGGILQLSLAENKGEKMFALNVRNAINLGVVNSTIFNNSMEFVTIGYDKQLYYKIKRVQLLASFGLGYKFTSQIPSDKSYDNAIPSQFHFRLGMEVNYMLNKNVSVGLVYSHFSNGGTTPQNIGYDFYGMKLNYLI